MIVYTIHKRPSVLHILHYIHCILYISTPHLSPTLLYTISILYCAGEIPPYWITRAARLAGNEAYSSNNSNNNSNSINTFGACSGSSGGGGGGLGGSSDMPEELDTTDTSFTLLNRLKLIIIKLLKNYGFYGVLLMASFPNIAFDICGIYCGHYLMPFWTFFGATFIGKAIIRNSYTSIIYVALCSEVYLEYLIHILQYITPDSLHCDQVRHCNNVMH